MTKSSELVMRIRDSYNDLDVHLLEMSRGFKLTFYRGNYKFKFLLWLYRSRIYLYLSRLYYRFKYRNSRESNFELIMGDGYYNSPEYKERCMRLVRAFKEIE